MVDSDDWPKPSEDELPDMYEEIESMLSVVETQLRKHFEVENNSDAYCSIRFSSSEADDYLAAMDGNREVMVPFFQKVVGLPDREFERQYGISGIGQRLSNRKSSIKGDEDAKEFASILSELMPESLTLQSLLYTFFKMWEGDQRRFYRMKYEEDIRDFLKENGYPNFKGNSLPGEPDFVIPQSKPYEVIGEVRVIQKKDKEKRFKEFRSEAAEAADNFPEAHFVAVANMGAYIERHEDREQLRKAITKGESSEIDAVFFHDEREEFLEQLDNWGVTKQRTL